MKYLKGWREILKDIGHVKVRNPKEEYAESIKELKKFVKDPEKLMREAIGETMPERNLRKMVENEMIAKLRLVDDFNLNDWEVSFKHSILGQDYELTDGQITTVKKIIDENAKDDLSDYDIEDIDSDDINYLSENEVVSYLMVISPDDLTEIEEKFVYNVYKRVAKSDMELSLNQHDYACSILRKNLKDK